MTLRRFALVPLAIVVGIGAGTGIHDLAGADAGSGSRALADPSRPERAGDREAGGIQGDRSRAERGAADRRASGGVQGRESHGRSLPASAPRPGPEPPRIEWRNSTAVGTPAAGRLRHGVALPAAGRHWVSWDPVLRRSPSRRWRRFGTDRLLRTTLAVMRDFGAAHSGAPRVAIGDLSRPRGGEFGPRWGYIGHATHQNGLDVDVYYPRRDGREKPPEGIDQVDVGLAQDLVDRFVAAGAEVVYVGPSLPLTGPAGIVVPLANHDNHLHARLPPEG